MDNNEAKYCAVLDIVEHPDRYSSEQLKDILSDPETREIYNLICKTDSAMQACRVADVDAEWKRFSEKHSPQPRKRFFSLAGNRAASILAVAGISLAAVAAGIAVAVTAVRHDAALSDDGVYETAHAVSVSTAAVRAEADTIKTAPASMLFEDDSLETIMQRIADIYGVEVKFKSRETASLRLYYRLDLSLPLGEIVSQLNTFEQINISQNGNILIIE